MSGSVSMGKQSLEHWCAMIARSCRGWCTPGDPMVVARNIAIARQRSLHGCMIVLALATAAKVAMPMEALERSGHNRSLIWDIQLDSWALDVCMQC